MRSQGSPTMVCVLCWHAVCSFYKVSLPIYFISKWIKSVLLGLNNLVKTENSTLKMTYGKSYLKKRGIWIIIWYVMEINAWVTWYLVLCLIAITILISIKSCTCLSLSYYQTKGIRYIIRYIIWENASFWHNYIHTYITYLLKSSLNFWLLVYHFIFALYPHSASLYISRLN